MEEKNTEEVNNKGNIAVKKRFDTTRPQPLKGVYRVHRKLVETVDKWVDLDELVQRAEENYRCSKAKGGCVGLEHGVVS